MQDYGIIGYPLQHSLSPFFHNTLFQRYNKEARYFPFSIKESDIPHYIDKLKRGTLSGLSVTAPYKYTVCQYCDHLSLFAQYTGVVNTLTIKHGKLYGDNFDIIGLMKTIQNMSTKRKFFPYDQYLTQKKSDDEESQRQQSSLYNALIIGTGATAVSAIVALSLLGSDNIYVVGRSKETLLLLKEIYNIIPVYYTFEENQTPHKRVTPCLSIYDIPFCSVLVMTIQYTQQRIIPYQILKNLIDIQSFVCDVHYSPRISYLLQDAMKIGSCVSNGYLMFITQAQLQFTTWTSIIPTIDDIQIVTKYYHVCYPELA